MVIADVPVVSYSCLHTGGPMVQVCRLGPKVGSRLTLFCIHYLNSRNDSWVMMSAP